MITDMPIARPDKATKEELKRILHKNHEQIVRQYASYSRCIRNSLTSKHERDPNTLRDLCLYLSELSAYDVDTDRKEAKLLSQLEDELKKTKVVYDVIELLSKNFCVSIFDIRIFEDIVNEFKIDRSQEALKYPDYLKEYIEKHKLSEIIGKLPQLGECFGGHTELVYKLNIGVVQRVTKIIDIQKKIADILDINQCGIILKDVEEGCVVVTSCIPTFVAEDIFTRDKTFSPEEEEKFQSFSVLWLQCGPSRKYIFSQSDASNSESVEEMPVLPSRHNKPKHTDLGGLWVLSAMPLHTNLVGLWVLSATNHSYLLHLFYIAPPSFGQELPQESAAQVQESATPVSPGVSQQSATPPGDSRESATSPGVSQVLAIQLKHCDLNSLRDMTPREEGIARPIGSSKKYSTPGLLVKRGSLFDALRSANTGHCCAKHFLMNIYPKASTCACGVSTPSSCSDLKRHKKRESAYVRSSGSSNNTLGWHAVNEDEMSRRPQSTAVSQNTGLSQPSQPHIPPAIQAHPAFQHPIIRDVTQLIHASAFSKVTQRVEPMLQQVFDVVKVPLYFIDGLSFFKCGKYNDAKARLNTCIELCVPIGTKANGDVSLCHVYLGDTEFNSRNFVVAAEHYKKAAAMYSAVNMATIFRMVPLSLSAIHAKCGLALRKASKHVDSVQEYIRAIRRALTDKDKLSANSSLGNLYRSLGENTSALTHYEQSVLLSEELGDYISLGWAHGNMGNAYLGLFHRDKALYHLQKSLDLTVVYEPTPQAIGRTYNNLGTAYHSLNELDKAQEYYDLALSQAIYGKDILAQACVDGNIGNVFMLRKKYGEAILFYDEVLTLSKDRSTLSTAHHNRGCAYYEWAETKMDALSKPEPMTEHSAKSTITGVNFYVHGLDFTDIKANTYPRRVTDSIVKYYRLGSEDLQEVIKFHEENLDSIKGSARGLSLSISLFEINARSFHRYQDCLVNLGKYEQALLVAEQSRARTLGEVMLKRKGWSLPHKLDSPLPFDQIARMISYPVLYLSYTGARLLGWVFVLKDGNVKMNMFEIPLSDDQFEGQSFDYHVMYSLTEELVERSFEMYRAVTSYEESSKPLEVLYNLIAKPLLCILEKHTDLDEIHKIVVIPDSITALLPYSSLYSPKSAYFGDKISFQLMPSLLTMGVLDQLPDANVVQLPTDAQNMCIAGNPTIPMFNYKDEVWNLGKLPHAKKEAEWVSHILKTTPILNEQATKSAILMRIMSAKVIHLATHGSASAGFLAFGAMVSGPRDMTVDHSNVLLYPEEVEQLNISPALVVLSSCDSGRGVVKADGIQGMARAFILAGAQAVLTTLWRVPDESAVIFMQFFYQYMMDGMKSTLALRKAILSIRCFSKYSQYIHWSGYQLTGRDVEFESPTPRSTQVLNQRLGPGLVFPRLSVVKTLEATLVNDPCPPTDVQVGNNV